MRTETLVAFVVQDEGVITIARINHKSEVHDVIELMRDAIKDFLENIEDAFLIEQYKTWNDFNWGDALTAIPDSHWEKFDISVSTTGKNEIVNHDENFIRYLRG